MTDPLRPASPAANPVRAWSDVPHRLADLEIVRSLATARLQVMLGVLDSAGSRLDKTTRQLLKEECACVLAALDELDVFRDTSLPGRA